MNVVEYSEERREQWQRFVRDAPNATLYHRIEWREIIRRTAGHDPIYLMAFEDRDLYGVLPLFLIGSRLFGRMLVSMPFLNYGGVCATNASAEDVLLEAARETADRLRVKYVELRHLHSLTTPLPSNMFKVTFLIPLEDDPDEVWKRALHSNVRNKVRKARKEGIQVESGPHLTGDFYEIYSHNLRDLGTPVMPESFFQSVVSTFGEQARVYVARLEGRPVGAKLVLFDKDAVHFVWAASIRRFLRLGPTPLLNWEALKDACLRGMRVCDMGRSTKGSGPEQFKKYWGGQEKQLYWQYLLPEGMTELPGLNPTNPRFSPAINTWKRLPLFVTRKVGPYLAVNLP